MRAIRFLIAAALFMLFGAMPRAGSAQAVPITDVAHRAHVVVNAGAMVFSKPTDWSGASFGGAALYNLHQNFSIYGAIDQGIPVNKIDDRKTIYRALGSVRVSPNAFVGFGYAWVGDHSQGALAQLMLYRPVMSRLDLYGSASYVLPREGADDYSWFKAGLSYQLLGTN